MTPSARHLELLLNLKDGMPYERAVFALTDQSSALRTAFECTLHGWVDRGRLTAEGIRMITPEIKILGPGSS